jgi:hypothetical protein
VVRRFVASLSDECTSGFARVRCLTFPGFAQDRGEERDLALVHDCVGLRALTLGFTPDAVATNRYDDGPGRLRDVDDYLHRSQLDQLPTTRLNRLTLVRGPLAISRPLHDRPARELCSDFGPWLQQLAEKLKASFAAVGKRSVRVYVDNDECWDQAGVGQKREIML